MRYILLPKINSNPKEGITNVDTRLHRPIYISYEKQFQSKYFFIHKKYKNISILYVYNIFFKVFYQIANYFIK